MEKSAFVEGAKTTAMLGETRCILLEHSEESHEHAIFQLPFIITTCEYSAVVLGSLYAECANYGRWSLRYLLENFGQEEQCPTSLGPLPPFNLDGPCKSLRGGSRH